MVAPRPSSSPSAQPPPDLPNMPDVGDMLSGYLRNFALWCRHGFADKMSATSASPAILLQAYDAPPGTTPKVFRVRVNSAGALVVTQTVAADKGSP